MKKGEEKKGEEHSLEVLSININEKFESRELRGKTVDVDKKKHTRRLCCMQVSKRSLVEIVMGSEGDTCFTVVDSRITRMNTMIYLDSSWTNHTWEKQSRTARPSALLPCKDGVRAWKININT